MMKLAGLGSFWYKGRVFRLKRVTPKPIRPLIAWFGRGDTMRSGSLLDRIEQIATDKYPKQLIGGLTRNEHQPAILWKPRKAFKLPSI